MIKFCSYGNISTCKDFILCHDIEVGSSTIIRKGAIINDSLIKILSNDNDNKLLIVSDNNQISKEDFKNFIIDNFSDIYEKEFTYLNKRYNYIFDKKFQETMITFFKLSILSLDASYLLTLLTNPVVLRKSIDVSILSFYFSLKMKLTPREIEDVFYSSILCNINLCRTMHFRNIENDDFLKEFKKANNSYEVVKDDKSLSNNVKRIILYYNDGVNIPLYINDKNEEVLKDPTLEILQLTNDILTYNFEDSTISLYSKKYTQIQPVISDFFKNMKNMKHKVKINKLKEKLKLW